MFLIPPDSTDLRFPPVDLASPEGLLAVGGDLGAERLLQAYRQGIFPWYSDGEPILWWSPDPRAVLLPQNLRITRSLRKALRQNKFTVTMDTAFDEVIKACAAIRSRQPLSGTWITAEMQSAYCQLHRQGYAHSVECWYDGKLAGGIYGISLGRGFFGESMFTRVTDASKVALAWLCRQLIAWNFLFVDCQVPSDHVCSLGAETMRRTDFIDLLELALESPDRTGPWKFDIHPETW